MITQATEAGKIRPLPELVQVVAALRPGRTVVHCHGVFDLLHVGHIRHLESAKRMGDILVVTITPDRYVNKGPGRPVFAEQLRAEALAALGCVDFVAVNLWPKAVQTLHQLRPDLYVKGPDYRDPAKDVTGGIDEERRAVEAVGGRLVTTDDPTFSSSHLINRHLSPLPEPARNYLQGFVRRYGIGDVLGVLERIRHLRVLVVGEAIIDDYQYVEAIGKSSKEPILAVKRLSSERFAGGSLAVANHAANFCRQVSLLTVLGEQDTQEEFIRERLNPAIEAGFIHAPGVPTIVKRRFIDRYFFQKLFEVYEMNDRPLDGPPLDALLGGLRDRLAEVDVVIAIDFGHGMIGREAVELLCRKAKFLAVNAQSNAGNAGYHTVSKYPRADYVSLAENEIRLECRDRQSDLKLLARQVASRLNCGRLMITRGSHGCLGLDNQAEWAGQCEDACCEVPALATQVKDRMGAGDSFLALTAPCVAVGAPMEVVGLIGNAAAAQKVAAVGNGPGIDRAALAKHLECLMK